VFVPQLQLPWYGSADLALNPTIKITNIKALLLPALAHI